jgi:tetratricopeptide (TPR) repeat protein
MRGGKKMKYIKTKCSWLAVMLTLGLISNALAAERQEITLKVDQEKVRAWNRFADRLYTIHKILMEQHEVRTETEHGGYAEQPDFYTETRYYDKKTNQLLSRIQRVNHNPTLIHLIEVNIYNRNGRLVRDYMAAYLPMHRNAPIQALVNLHGYHDQLHAFRQFDASGEYIYEQCQGKFNGKPVMLSLEDYEFSEGPYQLEKVMQSTEYRTCFGMLPSSADEYVDVGRDIMLLKQNSDLHEEDSADGIARRIAHYSKQLEKDPKNVELLIRRGDLYFQIHEFEQAIADYSDAIELDANADEAWFGRGMARGRYGEIRGGIQDLSVYIQRHPKSSRAYTKRGVRYLWIKEDKKAETDLGMAIKLDAANAEAHDDLGVILARRGDYARALRHFNAAVSIDPSYFKAFHNLAMVYYINGQDVLALDAADKSLALVPEQRNTLLLKANILKSLGRNTEAAKVKDEAEFLPEGSWSERVTVE